MGYETQPQGWSQVRWSASETAWAEPGTFRAVRVQVTEAATHVSEAGQGAPQPQPASPHLCPRRRRQYPQHPRQSPPTPTPIPGGGVTGGGGIVVSQSLTVRAGQVTGANGLVTVNDEGSAFAVALETTVGSTFQGRLMLRNASSSPLNGNIQLQLTAGFQVGAAKNDGVTQVGQIAAGTWLFTMAGPHGNLVWDVALTLKVPAAGSPDFTGFKGDHQAGGGLT